MPVDDTITLSRAEYEALADARDHAIAMRAVAVGAATIPEDEMDDFLITPSAIAFFRKRAGLTPTDLARQLGVSQPYQAQLEQGRRKGSIDTDLRLACALGVRVEDLVEEDDRYTSPEDER